MNKEDAVFYTQKLRHGYNCHMPVVKYAKERSIQNGAIIVIDMDDDKGLEKHNGKDQIEYMKEVFNALKKDTLTISCAIEAAEKKRSQKFVEPETVIFTRKYSGSVLRGSKSVGNLHNGKDLEEVIKNKNPIIVMGFDANFCVQSSIFGSHNPQLKMDINGLLDIGKTVITSKTLLVPINTKLEQGYGVLAGQ